MAGKKKGKKSGRKAPMKVVSLKTALHMVRQAQHRIAARGFKRRRNPDDDELDDSIRNPGNPLRHFPKLKGKGRPAHKRKWDMVTRLANGMIAEKTFKATKDQAYRKAQRLLTNGKSYEGSTIKEIILDDGH